MKRAKQIFALLLAAALLLTFLPLFSQAAGIAMGNTAEDGLSISGTPDSTYYKPGQYTFTVDSGSKLQLSGPVSGTAAQSLSNDIPVVHYGLRVRHTGSGWTSGNSVTFTIVSVGGTTTVSDSSNTVLVPGSVSGTIRKNRSISPTFRVVDYNVRAGEVDGPAELTGYTSNDSFPLQSSSSQVTITTVSGGPNGMATFEVTLPVRYTGKGNSLSFTLSYNTTSGVVRTLDCYAVLPNVEPYVEKDDDEDDDEEPDPLTPHIIVESYSYGGSSVVAGTEFALRLVLRNTSTTNTLQNIVMNVAPQGVFSMASSSNTIYIEQLFAGSTMEKVVNINTGLSKVTDDEDVNSINIEFSFQYLVDKVRKSSTSSERITLPVDFPDRFELGVPEMDSMAFTGQEMYLSVPMVNKGRSSVYNLTAKVTGDMNNPGQSQYIGNLAAGTESSADFSVMFTEPGEHAGQIIVTYEDANMNPKELSVPFTVSVQNMEDMWGPEPGGEEPFPGEFEPSEPAGAEARPERPALIALGLAVCAMTAYVTVQKAKAKRSIFADEDI